jgi:hypothetical protein
MINYFEAVSLVNQERYQEMIKEAELMRQVKQANLQPVKAIPLPHISLRERLADWLIGAGMRLKGQSRTSLVRM